MKFNKSIFIIILITTMFSFLNKSHANYEKIFFDFSVKSIEGEEIKLSNFKGKTVLIVNVASKCGFTKQYDNLQKLSDIYKKKGLIVIGLPSNQFGGQEPGSNKDIKKFCETNFNINFLITDKYEVKGKNAHPIYVWAKKNFGNSAVPKWNFHKILINKDGKVEDTFSSFVDPMSKKITKKIENLLN